MFVQKGCLLLDLLPWLRTKQEISGQNKPLFMLLITFQLSSISTDYLHWLQLSDFDSFRLFRRQNLAH
jgi:hypothetical protein